MIEPFNLLRESIKAAPALKYALGVAGLLSVVAIVQALNLRPDVAGFGALIQSIAEPSEGREVVARRQTAPLREAIASLE